MSELERVVAAHIADLRASLHTLEAYRLLKTAEQFRQAADELEAALRVTDDSAVVTP